MSCLFRALSKFIPRDDEDLIRQKICNYLILNQHVSFASAANYIQWETKMDLQTYVNRMRMPTVWGSAIEIQVFCELYNFIIIVYHDNKKNQMPITFSPTRKNRGRVQIGKLHWNGSHYDALIS